MDSHKADARLIGTLFLAAFVLYGGGNALVASALGTPDSLATIAARQTTVALGVALMSLNSVAVAAIGVLFFPILAHHGERTAQAYLAARIVEAVLLAIGALALLLLVPLSQRAVAAGEASETWATVLGSLLVAANALAYQIAMISLGLGSIFLCTLLYRIRLIPRPLASGGALGYAIFLMGASAELFGLHVGVALAIPGGLFELVVALRLLIKGFQPAARGKHAGELPTPTVRTAAAL